MRRQLSVGLPAFAIASLAISGLALPHALAADPDTPATSALPGDLEGVSSVAADDVWAVGFDSAQPGRWTTLAEHWDGRRWTRVHTPSPGSVESVLNAVDAVSADDVWAVGERADQTGGVGQRTLVEHWDGSRWSRIPSPTPTGTAVSLQSVSAVSADDVWAVGSFSPPGTPRQTLTLHWDGASWLQVPSPNPSDETALEGVTALASDDVWAAGYSYDASTHDRPPMLLHWDGSSWSRVDAAPPGRPRSTGLLAIGADSSTDIWTSGWRPLGQGYTEHWDGTRWSTIPEPGTPALFGIAAITPTDVWAVGQDDASGSIAVEHWDGSTWNLDESLTPKRAGLSGVTAVSAQDVWAVGSFTGAHGLSRILIEHNDGTGWRRS